MTEHAVEGGDRRLSLANDKKKVLQAPQTEELLETMQCFGFLELW